MLKTCIWCQIIESTREAASPGCSEGLLGAGKDSITGCQNEPCGVSSPHINCKCFLTAPFPATNVAVESS